MTSQHPIIIVSGLPRSGTSLMMQILKAGGIEPVTDGERVADYDNPKGYLEWEPIKRIGQDHRVLSRINAQGKALKAISTLLPKLPKAYHYKVLFMRRDIDEVMQSQAKMLEGNDQPDNAAESPGIAAQLAKHNANVMRWAQEAEHIELAMVDYRKLVEKPHKEISRIATFLNPSTNFPIAEMCKAVDPNLYRNRQRGSRNLLVRMFTRR